MTNAEFDLAMGKLTQTFTSGKTKVKFDPYDPTLCATLFHFRSLLRR